MELESNDLYIIRKVHRLSMQEMGEALGVSAGYVNHIEKEYEPLTDRMKERLIETFELSPYKINEIRHVYEQYKFTRSI